MNWLTHLLVSFPPTRLGALRRLCASANEKDLPILLDALTSPKQTRSDPKTVAALREAVQNIGAPAVEALTLLLKNGDKDVRERSTELMAGMEPTGSAALERAFADENVQVRSAVLHSIDRSARPWALEIVLNALADPDQQIRTRAFGILEQKLRYVSTARLESVLLLEQASARIGALKLLEKKADSSATASVIKALSDNNLEVKQAALAALQKTPNANAMPALAHMVQWGDKSLKEPALTMMGLIGTEDAVATLKNVVQTSSDSSVQRTAIRALGQTKSPEAVPELIAVLKGEISGDESAAIEALGAVGDAAVPQLSLLMSVGNSHALEALGKTRSESAFQCLHQALERELRSNDRGNGRTIQSLVSAIGETQSLSAVDPLIRIYKTGQLYDSIQWAIVKSIGSCALDGAAPEATTFLLQVVAEKADHPTEVRAQAVRALGEIGDKRALPVIQEILDSYDEAKQVRSAADWATDRMRGMRVWDYSTSSFRG